MEIEALGPLTFMIRQLLLSLVLCCSSLAMAQMDTNYVLQVQQDAEHFFSNLHRIELVELKPALKIHHYRNRFGLKRTRHEYWNISCIRSRHGDSLSIDTLRIGNRCELDTSQFTPLIQALYFSELSFGHTSCYEPRNGICFYNNVNEFIGFIEVCFECGQMKGSGAPCMTVYDKVSMEDLKVFFEFSLRTKQHID